MLQAPPFSATSTPEDASVGVLGTAYSQDGELQQARWVQQFAESLAWNYRNYIRVQFKELTKQWKADRRFASSTDAIVKHPAYQQIIELGPVVIPFILEELKNDPDYWFWALAALAKTNPVPPESRGDLEEMTATWLDWGRTNGRV